MPRQQSTKSGAMDATEKEKLVQLPFRCNREIELRILKARGNYMIETGQNITGNAFMLMLVEEGLKKFEG